MSKIARNVSVWLYKQQVIEREDIELYEYGVFNVIIAIMPVFMVLCIGFLMHGVVEGMIMLIPFLCIRKYSGGYHATYLWACTLVSCGALILCNYIILQSSWGYLYWIMLGIAVTVLWSLSPIDAKNKRLTEKEKIKYQKRTRSLLVMFLLVIVLLSALSLSKQAKAVSMGIILTAALQIPCVINKDLLWYLTS